MRNIADSVVLAVLVGYAGPVQGGTTNTNRCIINLGGIRTCEDLLVGGEIDVFALNFNSCCNGVRTMIQDGCEYNPVVDQLLGEEGSQVFILQGICRVTQPFQWKDVAFARSADSYESHEYGCEESDMEIDGARHQSVQHFFETMTTFTSQPSSECLDGPAFAEGLAMAMNLDATYTVPYGIGTYYGINDIAEYLAIALPPLNRDFWNFLPSNPDEIGPNDKVRLDVSEDGSKWYTGGPQSGSFIRFTVSYEKVYSQSTFVFKKCETKFAIGAVAPTSGMRYWIDEIVQAADSSQRYGIETICSYHTAYCMNDPLLRQYDSETECLEYMRSLPRYTAQCGRNRPLAGLSVGCKFKHHIMISVNPQLHCPHIGKAGVADENGKFKCDDESECSGDEGQDDWLPVFNGTISDQRLALYAQDDIGYEDATLPCVLPLLPSNQSSFTPSYKENPEKYFESPPPPTFDDDSIDAMGVSGDCQDVAYAVSECMLSNFALCALTCGIYDVSNMTNTLDCRNPVDDMCTMIGCCPACEGVMKAAFECEAGTRGCLYSCNGGATAASIIGSGKIGSGKKRGKKGERSGKSGRSQRHDY